MIKRLFLLTAFVLLGVPVAWAQFGFGKPKDVAIVKGQPLIVLLEEEDPATLKKLAKKPQELADYKAYVADYNASMQKLVPTLWKFSPSVEFKSESELPALRKAKGPQRGVLYHLDFVLAHRHPLNGPTAPNLPTHYYTSEKVSAMMVDVVGNGGQNTVWRVQIAPGPIYNSDIIFSLKTIQQYLEARAANRKGADMRAELAKNGKKLRGKTLLLDEADLKDKLTAAEVKKVYPLPFEIVPRATIEEAVANGDARYACVRLVPVTESVTAQVVMDAADASMLAMSVPGGGGVRMMPFGGAIGNNGSAIGKSNLKDFAEAAGKK